MATSGRDYRHWNQGGLERHHIIDPRISQPARTDVLAVTAVAPNAAQAEMAAKTAFILGSHEGLAWLESRSDYAGLLVLENGSAFSHKQLCEFEDQLTMENIKSVNRDLERILGWFIRLGSFILLLTLASIGQWIFTPLAGARPHPFDAERRKPAFLVSHPAAAPSLAIYFYGRQHRWA